jgi:hypothetical protein
VGRAAECHDAIPYLIAMLKNPDPKQEGIADEVGQCSLTPDLGGVEGVIGVCRGCLGGA